MDALFVYFTRVQHLLNCPFYMLCYMRPTKLARILACFKSKVCRIKFVVLNATLCLAPQETFVLQMLHVVAGLCSLSNLKYFHSADILSTGLPE